MATRSGIFCERSDEKLNNSLDGTYRNDGRGSPRVSYFGLDSISSSEL